MQSTGMAWHGGNYSWAIRGPSVTWEVDHVDRMKEGRRDLKELQSAPLYIVDLPSTPSHGVSVSPAVRLHVSLALLLCPSSVLPAPSSLPCNLMTRPACGGDLPAFKKFNFAK